MIHYNVLYSGRVTRAEYNRALLDMPQERLADRYCYLPNGMHEITDNEIWDPGEICLDRRGNRL